MNNKTPGYDELVAECLITEGDKLVKNTHLVLKDMDDGENAQKLKWISVITCIEKGYTAELRNY